MNLQPLKTELTTDPLGRGYAGMTDAQAADNLNAADRTIEASAIPAPALLAGMVYSEWVALTADQKQYLSMLVAAGSFDGRTGKPPRTALLAMFNGGSQTRSNLQILLGQTVSRASELGLGAVTPSDIAAAKRLA